MADTREKLVELLTETRGMGIGFVIDNLIAHGVTVQEWIPVTERLPEAGKVLCITTKGHYKVMEWLATFNCWSDPGGIDFTHFKREYVTHWMPLPEPPKEE